MENPNAVASIEVTDKLVTHLRAIEILNLAEQTAKDMSLRFQVEDMSSAVQLISKLVDELTPLYDKLITGKATEGDALHVPNLSSLSVQECIDLKSQLSKAVSQIDKRISSEGK